MSPVGCKQLNYWWGKTSEKGK